MDVNKTDYIRDLPKFSGYLRNEMAKRMVNPDHFSKARNILVLEATGSPSGGLSYKFGGRFYYDVIYALNPHRYSQAVRRQQQDEASLRYAFVDMSAGDLEMRLGKQQIVWGEALGFFFADIVNAKDLREFVLREFEFIRIPQWAAELGHNWGATHATLVWQPILKFNKFGLPGSEFAFAPPLLPNQRSLAHGTKVPPNTLENSEVGGRLSHYVEGWDVSVFYLHGWDKTPTLFRMPGPFTQTLFPEHKRLGVGGATLTKEIAGIVFTAEGVYSKDKYFSVLDDRDVDGVVQKNIADYVVGGTMLLWGRLDTNIQLMEKRIFHHESRIFREPRVRTMASLWLKMGFFDDKIEPECFFQGNLRKRDSMVRPKINYKFGDHWRARFGADIFMGKEDGLFGQFARKDRLHLELQYDF